MMGILEWLNDNLPDFSINKPKKDENPHFFASNQFATSLTGSDPDTWGVLRQIKEASEFAFRRWLSEAQAIHGYKIPEEYLGHGQTPPLKKGQKLRQPTHPLAAKIF